MIALAVEQEDRWMDDVFVHEDRGAVCKLCALGLDDEDVELYLDHWNTIHGAQKKNEKKLWRRVFPALLRRTPSCQP